MSIGRRKYQPIALADLLVDKDRFDSNLNSKVHSFARMHIHIDMPDTRYLSAHHTDGLPITCSGSNPSTVAYQDHQGMTPFTTASSFNFPATADATLLTPVSNAGSPPLQQRPSTKDTMRPYHSSQPSNNSQQPTPPNTSTRLYYPSSYDMSSSSQSPSPMTVHPHNDYSMAPYMGQSPNHGHGQPSPKDDVPPPIHHYLGHYTVSGSCNEPDVQNYFGDVDATYITRGPGGQISHLPHHMMTTTAGPTPILTQPDPTQYRSIPGLPMTSRDSVIEDLLGPPNATYQHRVTTTTRRKPKKVPSQNKRAGSRPVANVIKAMEAARAASQDNDSESLGEGPEVVTLDDKCEEDSRFIFETRKNLVKSGMKGKGMWEAISKRYQEVYGRTLEKATLQMRLTRAFAKHAVWPEKEIERLKEAYEHVEKERYKLILERMRESGGGKCWTWTTPLIEAKLIDLGFEEPNIDEKANTRKRKRAARRRRMAAAQQNNHIMLQHGGEQWTNGLGLHHHADGMQAGHLHEDQEDMAPHYTTEQRNSYIDEVMSKVKVEESSASPEPDGMDVAYEEHRDERDLRIHQQSTRVAKQAVEHLMLTGVQM